MSNFFKNLLSNIGVSSSGGGDSAVGVDIGSSAIKVVEIRKKGGRAVLETYGAIALGPYADMEAGKVTNLPVEKVSIALAEVLKQSDVVSKSLSLSIPIQSSLVFTLELPAQISPTEIAAVVPTEARKYIPVPITEVSIDHFVLPKREPSFEEMNNPGGFDSKGEKTVVLVVATQNDAVARSRSILTQSNMSASFFEIEIFSSIRSNFEHELSPVLLIDFGASRTKLSIIEFGMVKAYHTIDRGGADISNSISKSMGISFGEAERLKKEFGLLASQTEKELALIIRAHVDYIFSETNNVLSGYEKKYNRTITKVVFTGGGSLMKGLRELAVNNFRAEVEIGHPFRKVDAPPFLSKVLENVGPEFAVALGLALRKLQ